MPSPVLETAQQRASEEMTGMSFLAHLEELRRRIIYSALYVVAGFGSYDWALWIAGILLLIGALAVGTMTRDVILPWRDAVAPGVVAG